MTPSEIFLDHYNGLRRVKQIGNLRSLFFSILFFSSIQNFQPSHVYITGHQSLKETLVAHFQW